MNERTDTSRVRGVDRVIELLQCLHAAREPLRIGELARRLNAPRSTIYELVNRLIAASMLEMYDGDARVFFGRAMQIYATGYLECHGQDRQAREEVARLARETGQTAQYCVLLGHKYTVLHMTAGAAMFRLSSDVGVPVPVPWTASGRLLLDHMTEADILRFVPPEDFILADGRRIDPLQFCAEVAQARARGEWMTTGLVDDFTRCMAAPVRDSRGVAVACICLVVVRDRPGEETDRWLALLRDSAARLSHMPATMGAPAPRLALA